MFRVLLIGLLLASINGTLLATMAIEKMFTETYPHVEGTPLQNCRTCHSPVVEDFLNTYGLELKESGLDFGVVEENDADNDDTSNKQEILNLTLPGSQAAAPGFFIFNNRRGEVHFNHVAHTADPAYLSKGNCSNCHLSNTFDKEFDDHKKVKRVAHKVCRQCHTNSESEKAPTTCAGCHQ